MVNDFAVACLEAPIGVAILARLEWSQRSHRGRLVDDPTSNPHHVSQAVEQVHNMSFGQLCEFAIDASVSVGPWTSGAELEAWASYLHANGRAPIAEALAERFGDQLHAPVMLEAQEWWLHAKGAAAVSPLFEQLDHVYENGELSWRALRAYGPTPDEIFDGRFGEAPPPSSRWVLPVTANPRTYEIHRPADWHRLCSTYPHVATAVHGTWALPGPNGGDLRKLYDLTDQHAAIRKVDVHLCPQWSLVSQDYDAVHLSWAGFITSEGYVLTKGRNTTMLRYWEREVTMWLADCFGKPAPLPLPIPCTRVVDATKSPARLTQDKHVIHNMLNRHHPQQRAPGEPSER